MMHIPTDPRLQGMRTELTSLEVKELRTPEEVDSVLKETHGTVLVIINSGCGCAAGNARPAVAIALKHEKLPEKITTVFAGQDIEATQRAREYFSEYPPSSPSFVLMKDGKPVGYIPRENIEGRDATEVAKDLTILFDEFC